MRIRAIRFSLLPKDSPTRKMTPNKPSRSSFVKQSLLWATLFLIPDIIARVTVSLTLPATDTRPVCVGLQHRGNPIEWTAPFYTRDRLIDRFLSAREGMENILKNNLEACRSSVPAGYSFPDFFIYYKVPWLDANHSVIENFQHYSPDTFIYNLGLLTIGLSLTLLTLTFGFFGNPIYKGSGKIPSIITAIVLAGIAGNAGELALNGYVTSYFLGHTLADAYLCLGSISLPLLFIKSLYGNLTNKSKS